MINEPVFIADNAECIRILTELGLVDKLQPEPPWTRAHTYFEYKDCWCAAAYDKGHKEEKDNGFSIIMLPKSLMSAEAVFCVCYAHLRDFRRDQVVEKEWSINEKTTKETNPGPERGTNS